MTDAKPLINVVACDSIPPGVVLIASPVKGTLDILPDKLVFTSASDPELDATPTRPWAPKRRDGQAGGSSGQLQSLAEALNKEE